MKFSITGDVPGPFCAPDWMHQEGTVAPVVFLPKMQKINLIMKKYQVSSHWGASHNMKGGYGWKESRSQKVKRTKGLPW